MKLRTDGISWQELDGELVILDLATSKYLTTNRSGAFLAKLLTEDRSAQDLEKALIAEYGIDVATAAQSVEAFVTALANKGLLATV